MRTIEIVPARLVHVGPIATNMREIDRIEAEAMGRTPKEALRIGLRSSLSAFTAIEERKPLAMFGVGATSLISGRGTIWLLGTDRIFSHGRALLTIGPPMIAHFLESFTVMENLISTRNDRAIRLLRRWGAIVGGEIEEHGGVEFVPFHFSRDSSP